MKKTILMVTASPSVSTTTGWPVGFWASELIHPYDAFRARGYEITVASPRGGRIELDALSDPRDPSGYSKEDALSLQYLEDQAFQPVLASTIPVAALAHESFDAIVVVGGQSPMFTFPAEKSLQGLFLAFHAAGKPSAALCHGTCLLLHVANADGSPFVRGRRMTGFANSEEDVADRAVGRKLMPFRIEDEARRLGARFEAAAAFQPFALRDGNLITGQQQHSGGEVARLVTAALDGGRS
jgi:putative intracellular protease/amidase